MRLFVYGTLKEGYGNNHYLRGAKKLYDSILKDHIIYFSYGSTGFPVAKQMENVNTYGEVWDIGENKTILNAIDRLEGEGSMYHRRYDEENDFWFYEGGNMWDSRQLNTCPVMSIENNITTHIWR